MERQRTSHVKLVGQKLELRDVLIRPIRGASEENNNNKKNEAFAA